MSERVSDAVFIERMALTVSYDLEGPVASSSLRTVDQSRLVEIARYALRANSTPTQAIAAVEEMRREATALCNGADNLQDNTLYAERIEFANKTLRVLSALPEPEPDEVSEVEVEVEAAYDRFMSAPYPAPKKRMRAALEAARAAKRGAR